MNTTSNIKTSAAALAFFLSPLAWIQPCPETTGLDENCGMIAHHGDAAAASDTAVSESPETKPALF